MRVLAVLLVGVALVVGVFLFTTARAVGPIQGAPGASEQDADATASAVSPLGSTPVEIDATADSEALPSPPDTDQALPRVPVVPEATVAEVPVGHFTVTGLVTPDVGLTLQEGASVRIHSEAKGVRELLSEAEVGPDGLWEDIEVELEPGATFIARYSSPNGVLKDRALGRPEPDSVVELEFLSEQGYPLWFNVLDAEGERVPDAVITGTWTNAEGESLSRSATARPDGYICVGGNPPGVITIKAEAPGYVAVTNLLHTVPEKKPALYVIELMSAGGAIRGKCIRGGAPVSDFDILSWGRAGSQKARKRTKFRGTDGTFKLADFARGTRFLVAFDLNGIRSAREVIDVTEQGLSELVLEIPPPRFARGQVIDAKTRAPILGAHVQPLLFWMAEAVGTLGKSTAVDATAKFEQLPISERNSGILISAPGYATREMKLGASEGDTDLGVVELHRTALLSVQLISTPDDDLARYFLTLDSLEFAPVQFPSDGFLSIPMGPGAQRVYVEDPLGVRHLIEAYFHGEQEWYREVVLSGGRKLHVEILPAASMALPKDAGAFLYFENAEGERTQRLLSSIPDPFVIDGLIGDWIDIQIAENSHVLTERHIELTDETEQFVQITLGGYNATLLVVDEHGKPLPGVLVIATDAEDKIQLVHLVTDTSGRASIVGAENSDVFFHLVHEEYGTRNSVPGTLTKDPDTVIRLVLAAARSVEIALLEGGLPVSGVQALFLDKERRALAGTSTSDADGLVRWSGLTPGDYTLRILHDSYWTQYTPIHLQDEDIHTAIELIRIATLTIQVNTESGIPVSSLPIQLNYTPRGESLSDWVQQNRWAPPATGLTTDSQGALLLKNLPAGRYTWSATLATGESLDGFVTLQPGDNNILRILHPE